MPSRNKFVRRRYTHLTLTAIVVLSLVFVAGYLISGSSLRTVQANNTAQTIPFSQDWTNTGLITASDNWSGVPGIEGYFLRNDAVSTTGVDPQTLLGDTFGAGTTTVELDVIANQTAPDTLSNGGLAEFHATTQAAPANANPVVALNGSGTADAPFIQINLNTTGQSGINVAYNVRDLDCSVDNAAQPVVLQYRVGNSGNYANVTGSYIADATTGGSICTLVTPISVALPAAADNQALVQLRIITANAIGNDEWIGIDDINITAGSATPTPTPTPSLSINDVTQAEGNAGTTTFTFTVSLNQVAGSNVTFDIATADGTAQDDNPATEDNDYVAKSETTRTILAGNTAASFTVDVNGDVGSEPNETFFVNITNIVNAAAGDVQGLGTITNDDISTLAIHTIQGNGATSPLAGNAVSTRGIVTLLKSNGYFLQEPDGSVDADPNTSEGIFVFTSTAPTVTVGSDVTVSGTVEEFGTGGTNTEITTVTNTIVNSTGNSLPTPVTLTTAILDPAAAPTQPQLEKYEDMRMTGVLTTVAPNDTFFDVYTVLTGVARPVREPGIEISLTVPPDPTSGLVDPNIPRWDENPERLSVDTNGRSGATGLSVTSNVNLGTITGPLDFAFAEYHLIPDVNPVVTNLSAVPLPTPLSSEFTVAGFNIENFNNATTQRQKAALAIRDVMRLPYIIGVAEIFDLADLQALATEINTISPGRTYQAHLVEADGTSEDNDQDVGFLVDTSRVQVNSVVQRNAAETYIDPTNGQPALLNDRPPLVLNANVNPTGANLPVIVVVNHLRSFIDVELVAGDGPRVRAKRRFQAESLAALLQEYQTNNPATSVISVGDYNAYQFSDGYTDPIATIKGIPTPDDQIVVDESPDLVNPNFANLVDGLVLSERYSFIFEGTPQALDHVIVNTVAQARNTRMFFARMNADFPDVTASVFASNAARPERNSDHDAAVAYFNVANNAPPIANPQSVTTAENTPVAITLTGSDANSDPLTFTIVTGPAHGSLNPGTSGASQTYTPTAGYSGSDSFSFKVNDGTSDSGTATVSITVNDGGTLQFSSSTYAVSEGTGSATITISRSGGSAGTATVLFSTSNGTAGSGDYTSGSETVTFNDGDLSKTVSVPITNDSLHEADETVNLALSTPGGSGQLGSPVAAVLTVQDDDPAGGIIRFSSTIYDTTESSGSTSITVERVGDTSLAATVDYATQDDSGAAIVIPCATANGLASSRCDFDTALGTLRFAAGEVSKTFTVVISQDNYVEGLEALSLTLSNPTGSAVLGTPSAATLRIADDASEPAANPIDDSVWFVRQHYHDFLNREADAPGLAFWTNQITSCGADVGCIEVRRINVSAAFFLSIEFQESGTFVRNFYVASLNRPNNMPRFLEFMRDTQAVGKGVIIGEPNAFAILEANKQAFALDFVTRAEFVGLYPTTATPAQYVDALYLHVGVTPTASERQAAIDEFAGAGTSTDSSSRARALRRIIQNSAFVQREFPRAFVQMQYFGYLRRNPDDLPDGNLDGYTFWLNKLNQFNGNFVQAEMVKAFITSSEYRHRFGQ